MDQIAGYSDFDGDVYADSTGTSPESQVEQYAIHHGQLPLRAITPNLPKARKLHSPSEWEAIRPRFTQLYINEKRKLIEVTATLRDELGFHATDKQFKDRIRKWGLKKNFKDSEKRAALQDGVISSSDTVVDANAGTVIPRRRLKRFARDEKLLYISRHSGTMMLPEPTADFDLILDYPRYIFDEFVGSVGPALPRAMHGALANIDALTKKRSPFLTFEVLGISDAVVRYGMKRKKAGTTPGIYFEGLKETRSANGQDDAVSLNFWGSLTTVASTSAQGDSRTLLLFYDLLDRVYRACQQAYTRNATIDSLPGMQPRVTTHLPVVKFKGNANTARALYLRLVAQNVVHAGARINYHGARSAELMARAGSKMAFCAFFGPSANAHVLVRPASNVSMHCVKTGDFLVGSFRIARKAEHYSTFLDGVFEEANWALSYSVTTGEKRLEQKDLMRHLMEARPRPRAYEDWRDNQKGFDDGVRISPPASVREKTPPEIRLGGPVGEEITETMEGHVDSVSEKAFEATTTNQIDEVANVFLLDEGGLEDEFRDVATRVAGHR